MSDYARMGFRIIAVAYRAVPENRIPDMPKADLRRAMETDLTFLGLVVLANRPKPEVRLRAVCIHFLAVSSVLRIAFASSC